MGITSLKSSNNNLRTFSLIWLDATVNDTRENIDAQRQLRRSVNHLKTFVENAQCEQYIRSVPADDRIVLIISGHLGRTVVPRIHQLRQVLSIYVYCRDKAKNEQWTNQFKKVNGVIVRLDELITRIRSDGDKGIPNGKNESLVFSIFNSVAAADGQSTSGLNGQFLHAQLLIDCLIRMKSTSTDKNELISFCKIQHRTNKAELKNIHEFEEDYSSDRALRWYTRPTFIYHVLNKALRTQNIDLLFLFRFFIRDIERQLEQHRCLSPIRVYRGQLMSCDELKSLRDSVGQFISINSFFSTTTDRDVALFFIGDPDTGDEQQRVLFEIDADPSLDDIKPFANIKSVSYHPDEEEVLMMIGSVFRLVNIYYGSNRIWTVQMRLCSDHDHDLKSVRDHMKTEFCGAGETSLGQLGNVLRSMGKFDDAERYYRRLLRELTPDHQDTALCYWGLGIVASNKGEYNRSLEWHRKALKIFQQTLKSNHRCFADSHNCIGSAYEGKGKLNGALASYKKALVIYQQVLGEENTDVALCFGNMGNIYREEKKYSKALECHRKALTIWQRCLPADHPHLGSTYNNIANVYYSLGRHNLALQSYNRSLEIKSKSLPRQHPSIASTLKNIGDVYESEGEFRQALSYFKQAAVIYHQTLPPSHPYTVGIKTDIRRVFCQSK